MSKSWRERIAEARERGGFTPEDRGAISSFQTCAVAEHPHLMHFEGGRLVGDLSIGINDPVYQNGILLTSAVFGNRFDEAERLLNAIEDRALELKRGQA